MKLIVYWSQPYLFIVRWVCILLITFEGLVLVATAGILELGFHDKVGDFYHNSIANHQRRAPFELELFRRPRKDRHHG